jgi:hypothetical protein
LTTGYGVNQIFFKGTPGTGAGQTIAIVDAYYDKNVTNDLATFDAQYGLAAPPNFNIYAESGVTQNNGGWALETALDVEWAHAVAPSANILLVEGQPTLTGPSNLLSAVTYATQQTGVSVVSMSWGTNEFAGENAYDGTFTTPSGHGGITFVASSGDSGVTQYPSASPNVLSVGGTTLHLNSSSGWSSETAWSGSGGGYSPYEPGQSWQTAALQASGLNTTARTSPDISWDANPGTGVAVYSSVIYGGHSGWFQVGGTSVGAPSWSALVAITDQGLALGKVGSLANTQTGLYSLASSNFHDITSGGNGHSNAGKGYDLVTGIGSPQANLLVPALVALNTPPPHVVGPMATHPKAPAGDPPSAPAVGSSATTIDTSQSGTGLNSSTSATPTVTPIAALTPNLTSNNSVVIVTPVIVVAPPPPLLFHLAPSAAPIVAQVVNSPIASAEELPTSLTHFGQGPELSTIKQFSTGPRDSTLPGPPVDLVEPFQPGGQGAREEAPIVPEGPPCGWLLPGLDAVIERYTGGSLRASRRRATRGMDTSDDTDAACAALFGAAVVVTCGYRLAIGDKDPFRRRWLSKPAAAGRRGRGCL